MARRERRGLKGVARAARTKWRGEQCRRIGAERAAQNKGHGQGVDRKARRELLRMKGAWTARCRLKGSEKESLHAPMKTSLLIFMIKSLSMTKFLTILWICEINFVQAKVLHLVNIHDQIVGEGKVLDKL